MSEKPFSKNVFIGIDVGGTFTDLVVYDIASAKYSIVKVPSNRAAPNEAVIAALDKSEISPSNISLIVHSTTVGANALLERRGSKVAFVTTYGFRDVLELGRTTRLVPHSLYNPYFRRTPALVQRRYRHTIVERMARDGTAEIPPSPAEIEALAEEMLSNGIEAVAIGFINSFRNSAHEEIAAKILRKYFEYVTISTDILNEIREFERFSAASINAYIMPIMAGYAVALNEKITERSSKTSFFTVGSHGGLLSTKSICATPIRTILSGPAAGIASTIRLADIIGITNIITLDVGGTSSDVALIVDGKFPQKRETILDGLVIKQPQLDIHTVGAGGGSIASFDSGGGLQVGPESAGAVPGPAAYGRGGESPTVTDANLVLGRLGAGQHLGRSLKLDSDLAVKALNSLAGPRGLSIEAVAEGVLRLAVVKMAAAQHEISAMRGHDPREFTLVSYGGAGPLHAALVAEEAGISQVIIPPMPGAFSALGTLCAPLMKDGAVTLLTTLDQNTIVIIDQTARHIGAQLQSEFKNDGGINGEIIYERQLDIRYQGQAHELTISIPDKVDVDIIAELFESNFEQEYGRRDKNRRIEIVNVRVIARIAMPMPDFASAKDGKGKPANHRNVFIDGEFQFVPIWIREDLVRDLTIKGPAIIEEMSSTTYIPPNWKSVLGQVGEIIVTREYRN